MSRLELIGLVQTVATPAAVLYALWRLDRRMVKLETLLAVLSAKVREGTHPIPFRGGTASRSAKLSSD